MHIRQHLLAPNRSISYIPAVRAGHILIGDIFFSVIAFLFYWRYYTTYFFACQGVCKKYFSSRGDPCGHPCKFLHRIYLIRLKTNQMCRERIYAFRQTNCYIAERINPFPTIWRQIIFKHSEYINSGRPQGSPLRIFYVITSFLI